ncbi:secretin N-terminal domain-containing protein, partial [Acidobacteriota bacterium]
MKKIAILLIMSAAFWNCSTFSQNYKLGTEAALNKNWDKAVEYFERAVLEDPDDSTSRISLLRAKISASYLHLLEARRLISQNKENEALVEYEKALFYDPSNKSIVEELRVLKGEELPEEKPEPLKIEPPVKLKVSDEKIQLRFTEANLRSIYQALGKHVQINILFDENFREIPLTINLKDMTFRQAINSLCLASKNFYRIIDERTVIIAPDQPVKRAQYELNAIKTFFLSNIIAQDILGPLQQMIRTQFKTPIIIADKNLNSVTVKDTPEAVELAAKIIKLWDKPKGEVVIDLEIMEVSRVKLKQLGLDLDQLGVGFMYGTTETSGEDTTASPASGWLNLRDIDFSKSENFLITL